MIRYTLLFCTLGLLQVCTTVEAQVKTDTTKTNTLAEVIVTATRTERPTSTLPLPAQIITGESIRKSGLSRLNEIIQEQTGLITVPDFGGGEGIQMQGLDASYTMILVDGQPLVGRTAGTLDLTRISLNNIERIEIVKGASSCLYGSEALAGVVNIITKKTVINSGPKLNTSYRTATFNTHDATINVEYGKHKTSFELFGNYFTTQGYNLSDNTQQQTVEPYHNYTIQPKMKIIFSDKINLSAGTRYYHQTQDNKAQIAKENYAGKSTINEWNHTILINHTINTKLKMVYDLYATHYKADEYLNNTRNQLFEQNTYNQWYYRPELRAHYKLREKDMLSAGIGINHETLDRTLFKQKANLNSEYLFMQYEWYIKQKWNILAGFRYDHHHQYQSQFSPKIAINYQWNKALSLKTSVGYGYKAPDLRQLYLDFTNSSVGYTVLGYNVASTRLQELQNQGQILYSNHFDFTAPLKPERSLSLNLGATYHQHQWTVEANLFYNHISNLIDTRAIAQKTNGQNVFSYFNINKIFTYGTELNATYTASENLNISAGYQYLIAKDKTIMDKLNNGEIFARDPQTLSSFQLKPHDYFGLYNRSRHTANFKINYTISPIKTSCNLRVLYKSKYGLYDANNNTILDRYDTFVKGYFLVNLSVTKQFKYGFSLQAGSINLFNYTDKTNIANLPGRQYFGKISYQF